MTSQTTPAAAAAVDRAVSALAPEMPAEERAEIGQRAAALAAAMGPAAGTDMKNLQNLYLTLGLPATRILFRHMVEAAGLAGKKKADAMRAIDGFSPITEVGSLRVEFARADSGGREVAHLLLEEVRRDYDFGAELGKIEPIVPPDKWEEVKKTLSMVLSAGRAIYAQVARAHPALIRGTLGLPDDADLTCWVDLVVDKANTTLLLRPEWPRRVGLRIVLESELGGKKK